MNSFFRYIVRTVITITFLSAMFSCSLTKYVPEDEYLLNKVAVKKDNKRVDVAELEELVQQQPNKSWTFLGRVSLRFYSLSGRDTTKWRNRTIRKMGEAPVIYNPTLRRNTELQLSRKMNNLGFLSAKVSSEVKTKRKRANVTYIVEAGEQSKIRHFNVGITDSAIAPLLSHPKLKHLYEIKEGTPFESARLDGISDELVVFLRSQGYYNLVKENFFFMVDTTVGNRQVDVTLMARRLDRDTTVLENPAFIRYKIRNVSIVSGLDRFDPKSVAEFRQTDTVNYRGVDILYGKRPFIRPSVLYANNFVRPGRYYSDKTLENTYSSMNGMSAVKQVSVTFQPVKNSDQMDASLTVSPANVYYWQIGVDGTNSAGDLGMASHISFQDRNIFNGSETFGVKLNGAFESIKANDAYGIASDIYYEYGGELSLTFPQFLCPFITERQRQQVGASTAFAVSLNWRDRPEYDRRFLSLDWKYKWSALRKRLNHTFDLYNVNYVVTPRTSSWFDQYLEQKNNALLRESYKDQLITRTSYQLSYASILGKMAQLKGFTIQASIDLAGTLPSVFSQITGRETNNGSYELFGIPFAQYAKGTFDYTKLFPIDRYNVIAAHTGVGLACPYGNSSVVPFEQQFFAGGPNSVRGWNSRRLGPGAYESQGSSDFINQTGDLKLLFNLEYRLKTESFLEYALFIDAGNVWTIKDYDNKSEGRFYVDKFLEQCAMAWGLGIRPNLGFLIIRFDVGMKMYDPSATSDRWNITHPRLKSDLAYHFAVGYPF
ncbi:MAG: BamA/TamA family outer membrane protein [Paludibacteraceae bacterium]|nr:BamA/TamA family outer membrane protein [Paludibacteraceae bacterium]